MCKPNVCTYIVLIHTNGHFIGITQHPPNDTFCEGSNVILSCVIFDNGTDNTADTTAWYRGGEHNIIRIPDNRINNSCDGDVVTSVLTVGSVSLIDNGTEYYCAPSLDIESYTGTLLIAGNHKCICTLLYICAFLFLYNYVFIYTVIHC